MSLYCLSPLVLFLDQWHNLITNQIDKLYGHLPLIPVGQLPVSDRCQYSILMLRSAVSQESVGWLSKCYDHNVTELTYRQFV